MPIRCIITPSTVLVITSNRVYIAPSTVRVITSNRVYVTPSTVRTITSNRSREKIGARARDRPQSSVDLTDAAAKGRPFSFRQ